jgi:hypothetical protein
MLHSRRTQLPAAETAHTTCASVVTHAWALDGSFGGYEGYLSMAGGPDQRIVSGEPARVTRLANGWAGAQRATSGSGSITISAKRAKSWPLKVASRLTPAARATATRLQS